MTVNKKTAIGTLAAPLTITNGVVSIDAATTSVAGLMSAADKVKVNGIVTGATDNAILRADGTAGATTQSSLVTIDDTGSVNIPTGQTYKINGTALAYSNITGAAPIASPTFTGVPAAPTATAGTNTTQLATTAFVTGAMGNLSGAMVLKGVLDCSASPNYPAGTAGDLYKVSVAGKVGGASGPSVEIGDVVICITTAVTGTHAAVGTSWNIIQTNLDGAQLTTAYNHSQAAHAPTTVGTTSGTIAAGDDSRFHVHTNKSILDFITASGDGAAFLANDGTYKVMGGDAPTTVSGGVVGYEYVTRSLEGEVYETMFSRYVVPSDGVLDKVMISLDALPSGQDFQVDIRKNGTSTTNSVFINDIPMSITTTQAAVNDTYVSYSTTNMDETQTTLVAGDVIYILITQVGDPVRGADFISLVGIKFTDLYQITGNSTTYAEISDAITLPSTPVAGETIYEYVGTGNNWVLTASSGYYIRYLTLESVSGGTLSSTTGFDCVCLMYIGAIGGHNTWLIKSHEGTLEVV